MPTPTDQGIQEYLSGANLVPSKRKESPFVARRKGLEGAINDYLNLPDQPPPPPSGVLHGLGEAAKNLRNLPKLVTEGLPAAGRAFLEAQKGPTTGQKMMRTPLAYTLSPAVWDLMERLGRVYSGVQRGAAELGPEQAKPLTEALTGIAMGTPPGLLRRPSVAPPVRPQLALPGRPAPLALPGRAEGLPALERGPIPMGPTPPIPQGPIPKPLPKRLPRATPEFEAELRARLQPYIQAKKPMEGPPLQVPGAALEGEVLDQFGRPVSKAQIPTPTLSERERLRSLYRGRLGPQPPPAPEPPPPPPRPTVPEPQVAETFGIELPPGQRFEAPPAPVHRELVAGIKEPAFEATPEGMQGVIGGLPEPKLKLQGQESQVFQQAKASAREAELQRAQTTLPSGTKPAPRFIRTEGFEHGIPNLSDPDDVSQVIRGSGGLKLTEDLRGELREIPAWAKNSKTGRTLDSVAEALVDEYPSLGTREAVKEKLADSLRRYPILKQEKAARARAASAAYEEFTQAPEAKIVSEIRQGTPPGDVPIDPTDWSVMGPVERKSALEFFRDTFVDESGLLRFSILDAPAQKLHAVADDLKAILAPASRGEMASRMAGILRPNLAELARKTERAHELLRKSERWMEGLTIEQQYRFIDALETGRVPRQGSTAGVLKKLLEERRIDVQRLGTGKLEHFIEDYFPHLWKDPGKAADAFAQAYGRRPLGGTGSFLKRRIIPTVKEGVGLGLEPVTTNPVTATLLKLREMDRYVMAQNILREMKETGLARLVPYESRSPAGWARINDKIARAGSAGQYWAPEPAARLLNNHLTPGLQGNALFDAYRGLGNMLNQMQLGFSAFHLGFVSMDVMQSRVALALQQLAAGRPIAAAKSVLSAPLTPLTTMLKGSKVLREYFAPGSQGAEMAAVVDQLIQAGGRARMDPFYGGNATDQFLKALRGSRYGTAAAKAWPAMMETISRPIMQEYVPRAKLGVFADLAQFELSKLPPGAPRSEVVRVLGRAWDSVDNRLGQMTYDNLFWNRTLKDALMASVRSVGWNLGTLREIGGGLADVPREVMKGRGFELTPRMAYVATLPFETAVLGAIIGYLYTGKGPETLKGYFYPKTGKIRRDGSEDRVSLPTYMKDIVAYSQHPWTTVKHKLSPTLSLMSEMLENEDYYGKMIRNPDDPLVRQMLDSVDHVLGSAEAFSVRGFQQQRKLGASIPEALPGFIGITPAPAAMTRTAEQQAAIERRINRQKLAKKRKQDINDPGVLRNIEDRLRAAGYLP